MILVNGIESDTVSANDRGLMYGDGVFRTLRASAGKPCCWNEHFHKLQSDCSVLKLTCPDQARLGAEIAAVAERTPQCVVKVVVTRGEGERGYAADAGAAATRIVLSSPLPEYPVEFTRTGVRVRICYTRVSIQPALAGVKHLNRLENVLARLEWSDADIAEGLMLDIDGNVIEGTMTNLFLVEGNALVTPDLSRCGVAGVQRERLREYARQAGIEYRIEQVSLQRVRRADYLFLVNSLIGVWQVCRLGDIEWKTSGPIEPIRQWLGDSCH